MNDSTKRRMKSHLKALHKQNREKKIRVIEERARGIATGPLSHNEHPLARRLMTRWDRLLWGRVAEYRREREAAIQREAEEKAKQEAEAAAPATAVQPSAS